MAGKTLLCVIIIAYIRYTTSVVVTNCEGNSLSVSCSSGTVINVISANYGRTTGTETCPHSSIWTTECFASNSFDVVSSLCNGQRSCTVPATNSVFGDPCVGTYKYLEVDYTCESNPDSTTEFISFSTDPVCGNGLDCSTERTCEWRTLSLSCSSGSVISIISANYGRTAGPEICPHSSIRTTSCFASNSLNIVSNLCNGQQSCTVVASNDVFDDPCVGTYKYLEVIYACTNNPYLTTELTSSSGDGLDFPTEPICGNGHDCSTESTCEGRTLSLSCSYGSVITIVSANYGRTAGPETCPHSSIRTTACYASNSLNIVGTLCNGQQSCTVIASNDVFGDPCVGTYKYLEVIYACKSNPDLTIELTPSSVGGLDFPTEPACGNGHDCLTESTCEGRTLSLSCSYGSVISIISANYGRRAGPETCPHSSIQTTACYALSSLNIVGNLCTGKRRCTVHATNSVFGDPCVGTYKYLEVDYTCDSNPNLTMEPNNGTSEDGLDVSTEPICGNGLNCSTERTCEGNTLSLSCSAGSVISTISANYGRTAGPETCPHSSIQTTSCYASNSSNIVGSLCNGLNSCDVVASNLVFGDPCVGTYKYLEVKYTCEPGPYRKKKRTCEGGSISLSCPTEAPVIVISTAMYGRQVPGSEFCPHGSIQTTNCIAPSSMATVQSLCHGRSSCTVAASNQVFGDPCLGTYKYLETEYACARRGRVCEHSMLRIDCSSDHKIVILDALYGRMAGPDICPYPRTFDQNCRASSSLRIVMDKCNGLSSCTVTASNTVFGDPCVGTFKYLEVLYECKRT